MGEILKHAMLIQKLTDKDSGTVALHSVAVLVLPQSEEGLFIIWPAKAFCSH